MTKGKFSAVCALGLAVALAALGAGVAEAQDRGVTPKGAFETLKKLQGDWTGQRFGNDPILVTYRVGAAGTAIVETQAPNTNLEMITMYYLDGEYLAAQHYCIAGNQPLLRLNTKTSKANDYKFEYAYGSNIRLAANDQYMSSIEIVIVNENEIIVDWGTRAGEAKSLGNDRVKLTRVRTKSAR